ncbi:MAG TPA: trehalose-6-phosphate synthase [Bryobacteraceae bacterium]|nr:trehalose-6-phosphate synthase [Bryobacteraceae bacterium]
MRLGVRLNLSLIAGVAIVSLAIAYYQTHGETSSMKRDLQRHAMVLAYTLETAAAPLLALHSETGSYDDLEDLISRFQDQSGLAGVAVYNAQGQPVAETLDLTERLGHAPSPVARAHWRSEGSGEFMRAQGRLLYIYELPIKSEDSVLGAIGIYEDAGYIQARQVALWKHALTGLVVQTALIVCVTLLILQWSLRRPLARLTKWLNDVHRGSAAARPDLAPEGTFAPLEREVARLAVSLNAARAAAAEEARLRDLGESIWTAERLRVAVESKLGGSRLFAISNREPYEHLRRNGAVECSVPASGLVTALEPILRACDGTWIAQATGDADRETVDANYRLRVPPGDPQYTLRRVWLAPEEERGFYLGFANEGLWPLCHIAHTRPSFRATDWEHYRAVNRRFADAFLKEAAEERDPLVLVQDYHFALVPRMIKEARPDARVAIFWHIPWPNPEAFAICPWQRELLDGLLGADLIGFHVQSHCNNFLDTVDRTLESRVDRERFAVNRRNHFTFVRPFPISVNFPNDPAPAHSSYAERMRLLHGLGVNATMLGIGVDRVDYTKGIPERFRAVEMFFERWPFYRRQFTFVQIGAPSRTHIRRYHELMSEVESEAERINRRFQSSDWKPIVFLARHHSHQEILPYYRAADVCMVTSLHDGMNLVAKEYIASRADAQGSLILSRFTGASQELMDALLVNPYDTEQLADAIHRGLAMPAQEKQARMMRMRSYVREHNIYLWAGNLISDLAAIRLDAPTEPARDEPRVLARAG